MFHVHAVYIGPTIDINIQHGDRMCLQLGDFQKAKTNYERKLTMPETYRDVVLWGYNAGAWQQYYPQKAEGNHATTEAPPCIGNINASAPPSQPAENETA